MDGMACGWCGDILPVDAPDGAIVAHCYKTGRSCDMGAWGSVTTREDIGPALVDGQTGCSTPSHAIQTNP